MQKLFGFGSYETAWAWLHKLRRAMVRPDRERPSGVVEVDETFVDGRTAGIKGAGTHKVPIMVAVERVGSRQYGRVRLAVANAPGTLQLVEFASSVVEPGSTIRTDGARIVRPRPYPKRRDGCSGFHRYSSSSSGLTSMIPPETSTRSVSYRALPSGLSPQRRP